MGGRLDASTSSTPMSRSSRASPLDHCEWLGSDTETIGREKAEIFRAGRPAVFGSRTMPRSIEAEAQRIGSRLLSAARRRVRFRAPAGGVGRGRAPLSGTRLEAVCRRQHCSGAAQYDNASAVLQVLTCLSERLPLSRVAIEAGLRSVQLAGRFQVIPDRSSGCSTSHTIPRPL